MTNEKLQYVLENQIELDECIEIKKNHIYYIKKEVSQTFVDENKEKCIIENEYEFIVIAEDGEKKGIILRCGDVDLHWFVLEKYRGQHVLSNALRTGVIKRLWSDNKKVTCCYDYGEDVEDKYNMTAHLAEIAGLELEYNMVTHLSELINEAYN